MDWVFLWISFTILIFVSLNLFTWVVWFLLEGRSTTAHGWAKCPCWRTVAPLVAQAPLSEKRWWGGQASQKDINRQAPHLTSVRGRRQGSVKVKTNRVLFDVDVGTSDELPLTIRQSFNDGCYSPSTAMEEREWQIMLEQFIASGDVVKNEVIDIDSNWKCLCPCDVCSYSRPFLNERLCAVCCWKYMFNGTEKCHPRLRTLDWRSWLWWSNGSYFLVYEIAFVRLITAKFTFDETEKRHPHLQALDRRS
jgi:hypothetical protein